MPRNEELLNTVFLGEVASVLNYGAFVRIPGTTDQGLIHKSQISSAPVEDATEVLRRGEKVWCKVISFKDGGKISLSMKVVNQGSGKDLDPNGVQIHQDEKRRQSYNPRKGNQRIELEAVLNTTCHKCGCKGHMAKDCFKTSDGKTYGLISDDEDSVNNKSRSAVPTPQELLAQALSKKKSSPRKDKKDKKKKKKKKKERRRKKKEKRKKHKKRETSSSSSSSSSESSSSDSSSSSSSSSSSEDERPKRKRKMSKSSDKSSSEVRNTVEEPPGPPPRRAESSDGSEDRGRYSQRQQARSPPRYSDRPSYGRGGGGGGNNYRSNYFRGGGNNRQFQSYGRYGGGGGGGGGGGSRYRHDDQGSRYRHQRDDQYRSRPSKRHYSRSPSPSRKSEKRQKRYE